jgi:hypothetical protein
MHVQFCWQRGIGKASDGAYADRARRRYDCWWATATVRLFLNTDDDDDDVMSTSNGGPGAETGTRRGAIRACTARALSRVWNRDGNTLHIHTRQYITQVSFSWYACTVSIAAYSPRSRGRRVWNGRQVRVDAGNVNTNHAPATWLDRPAAGQSWRVVDETGGRAEAAPATALGWADAIQTAS